MRLVNMQWFDTALYNARSVDAVTMWLDAGADINKQDKVCVVRWGLCVFVGVVAEGIVCAVGGLGTRLRCPVSSCN